MGKASIKVDGGKMVDVEVTDSEVSLTGDFFIQPAEARKKIESVLEGSKDLSGDEIVQAINEIGAELIGFSAENVVEAFQKARGDQS